MPGSGKSQRQVKKQPTASISSKTFQYSTWAAKSRRAEAVWAARIFCDDQIRRSSMSSRWKQRSIFGKINFKIYLEILPQLLRIFQSVFTERRIATKSPDSIVFALSVLKFVRLEIHKKISTIDLPFGRLYRVFQVYLPNLLFEQLFFFFFFF